MNVWRTEMWADQGMFTRVNRVLIHEQCPRTTHPLLCGPAIHAVPRKRKRGCVWSTHVPMHSPLTPSKQFRKQRRATRSRKQMQGITYQYLQWSRGRRAWKNLL